jgi:hypothetical protein
MRLLSRTGVPVHIPELLLERVIKQFVSVLSQEPEKWPHSIETLQQPFLLCRQLDRGIPSIHCFISSPFNWIDRVKADKK